ncbi:hypothetical protein NDU88_009728 [Pleurodeles waltl]|uniref:Uncharacterized protein n=1 Tax=Pleurodeles waltl TaxID=8319 RepID=A0AAV7QWK9_PLEWA|nr:hypothetical protein NDU88_009728 [Pleurodeles waltl]
MAVAPLRQKRKEPQPMEIVNMEDWSNLSAGNADSSAATQSAKNRAGQLVATANRSPHSVRRELPDQQAKQQQACMDKEMIMQMDTKNMLNMILEEIRGLKASQAVEVAALHVRPAKIEQAMNHLLERLKEAEARLPQLEDQVV